MTQVDGFMAAVPDGNREQFIGHSREMGKLFRDCGASQVVDCWGTEVPDGKLTSMKLAVQAEPGETVVFGWIVWPSEEARKAGWEKAMADPRMQPGGMDMPFDGKRMIFGAFEMVNEA